MRSGVLLLACAAAALPAAGCGSPLLDDLRLGGRTGPREVVDERAGAFRGLRIGDTREEVVGRLGTPVGGAGDGLMPLGTSWGLFGGPISVRARRGSPPVRQDSVMRYDGVSFVEAGGKVIAMVVTAPGAVTRDGVAIGEDLAEAPRAYPRVWSSRHPAAGGLHCDHWRSGEFGGFPYCTGRLPNRLFVWFGQDAVRTIAIGRAPFE